MSPFSYLSSLASFPTFPDFASYLPGISLPDNVQKRLTGFILRRTLGKFVKEDGLVAEKVEGQIGGGVVKLDRLDLDEKAINDLLPPELPIRFRSGTISSVNLQIPFPRILSNPLAISLDTVTLSLRASKPSSSNSYASTSEHQHYDAAAMPSTDLAASVLAVTQDFVDQSLSKQEVKELAKSVAAVISPSAGSGQANEREIDPFAQDEDEGEHEEEEEEDFHTPGSFPTPSSGSGRKGKPLAPGELPPASLIAGIVEAVLFKLQVEVKKVVVRLEWEGDAVSGAGEREGELDLDSSQGTVRGDGAGIAERKRGEKMNHALELRMERIGYVEEEVDLVGRKGRVLRVGGFGIWMSSEEGKDAEAGDPGRRSPPQPRSEVIGPDADGMDEEEEDERESESMYASALDQSSNTATLSPPANSKHLPTVTIRSATLPEMLRILYVEDEAVKIILKKVEGTKTPQVDVLVGKMTVAVQLRHVTGLMGLTEYLPASESAAGSAADSAVAQPRRLDLRVETAGLELLSFGNTPTHQLVISAESDDWYRKPEYGQHLSLSLAKILFTSASADTATNALTIDDISLSHIRHIHSRSKAPSMRKYDILTLDRTLVAQYEPRFGRLRGEGAPERRVGEMPSLMMRRGEGAKGPESRSEAGVTISLNWSNDSSIQAKVPGLLLSIDIPNIEPILPFLRAIASIKPPKKNASTVTAQTHAPPPLDITVDCVRIALDFPLQDRYYNMPDYSGNMKRELVVDVRKPHFVVGDTSSGTGEGYASLKFEQSVVFFGTSSVVNGFLVISPLQREDSTADDSLLPCLDIVQGSAAGLKVYLASVPHVHLHLDRPIVAGLQYLADDLSMWLDDELQSGQESTRENIRLISSRFFGPPVPTPLDMSVDDMESPADLVAKASVDEVLITLAHNGTVAIMQASDVVASLESLKAPSQGSIIRSDIATLDFWVYQEGREAPIQLFNTAKESMSAAATKRPPVLSASITSLQQLAKDLKQTTFDLNLILGIVLVDASEEAWTADVKALFKSPGGVFEDVKPSDITKVNITISETSVITTSTTDSGSLCFDIKQVRIRTAKAHHAPMQEYVIKADEIKLLAKDEASISAPLPTMRDWHSLGYCSIARLANFRSKVNVRSATDQWQIEVSRLDLSVGACADSLKTTSRLLSSINGSTSPNDEPAIDLKPTPSSITKTSSLHNSGLADGLRDMGFSANQVQPAEPDLLDDDLPTDLRYLSVSRKGKRGEAADNGVANVDGICIHHSGHFNLHSDHFAALRDLEGKRQAVQHKLKIDVDVTSCNVQVLLYDGYDWPRTRDAIQAEIKAVRRKLQKIKQMIASGHQGEADITTASSQLFNSVDIGLPAEADYTDPAELAAAVDVQLERLGSDTTLAADDWQALAAQPQQNPPPQTSRRKQNLLRSSKPMMEFRALEVSFGHKVPLFPLTAKLSADFDIACASVDILDHLPSSTWKSFLKTMPNEKRAKLSSRLPKDTAVNHCSLRWYPSADGVGTEARMRLRLMPLRMHVDQDAVDFLHRFSAFTESEGQKTQATPAKAQQFIQRVDVAPIDIKLDYKPKRVNLNSLRQGKMGELINLFHFEESKVTLRRATIRGVSGWGSVYDALLHIWSPDIRANQMSDLVGGAAPVRSLIQVGTGVADLVLLPIEQYRKDGRLMKGLERGGKSFARTTTMEAIRLGTKLATGTQVILERAETALRSDSPARGDVLGEGDYSVAQKISRYAEQPTSVKEGLSEAYSAFSKNVGSAAQTILAIPMEVHESTGNGAGRTVIRAVPLAVIQTLVGVTGASRKTLQGIRNQIDPSIQQELKDKYKSME